MRDTSHLSSSTVRSLELLVPVRPALITITITITVSSYLSSSVFLLCLHAPYPVSLPRSRVSCAAIGASLISSPLLSSHSNMRLISSTPRLSSLLVSSPRVSSRLISDIIGPHQASAAALSSPLLSSPVPCAPAYACASARSRKRRRSEMGRRSEAAPDRSEAKREQPDVRAARARARV